MQFGDIKLNEKSYRIDLNTYRIRDIIDFAPRASVPGGSVVMSDLSMYQPLVQTDFRRGFGYQFYNDASAYLNTIGDVDTRQDGLVMRYTQKVASDTNNNAKQGFTTFNNRVYSWGAGGLRYFDGSNWNSHSFSGIEHASSSNGGADLTLSLSFEHTVPSYGQNKILIVKLALKTNVTVSSVKFGSTNLTQLSSTGTAPKAQIWYLLAPTAGTNNITVTLAAAASVCADAMTLLYVDQGSPFGTPTTGSGTGTSASIAVASDSGKLVIDILSKDGTSADGLIADPTQTQTMIKSIDTTNSMEGGGSKEAGATSTTMSWSWTNSRNYVQIGVSINPSTQAVTGTVNFALNAGSYLFYCPDGARIRKISLDTGVDSEAGLDSSSIDYKWLIMHNGFIYAGKDNSNRIHYSSEQDLSDLEGTVDDPSAIYVGAADIATIAPISYAGNLYVSRADGLWSVGEDGISRIALNYYDEISSVNFRSMADANGFLLFPVRDRVIQWNGVRVNNVTPDKLTDSFPFTTYGNFDNFVSTDDLLYMTARTNESPYQLHLLCFDGTGWHKLSDLTSSTDDVTAMGYDTVNNRIWLHMDKASGDITYYIQLQNNSYFPYANFSLTGQHSLITSRLDMGFRRVIKSTPSILIEAENVTDSRYISVYYQLDGDGDWRLWGNITENGITELYYPGGYNTVEYNYIQFRFDFITDSEAQSPIFNGYTLRFILRPKVLFGWNFSILAASGYKDDYDNDERTAAEILKEIQELRDSKQTIEFVDVLGRIYRVYITAITGTPTYRRNIKEGEIPDIEYSLNVNLVSMEPVDAFTS